MTEVYRCTLPLTREQGKAKIFHVRHAQIHGVANKHSDFLNKMMKGTRGTLQLCLYLRTPYIR